MSSNSTSFIKMIDNMIEFSEYDDELSDGIKWKDWKTNPTFLALTSALPSSSNAAKS